MNELEFYTKRYNDELSKPELRPFFDENRPVYGNYCGLQQWIGNELFRDNDIFNIQQFQKMSIRKFRGKIPHYSKLL